MKCAVLSFEAMRKRGDWSTGELAEFYRAADVLGRAGFAIEIDRGLTDEGDPWLVFCHADSGEIIAHFAKIDREYIVDNARMPTPVKGAHFADVMDTFVARYGTVLPPAGHQRLYIHPAAALTAMVATLAVMSEILQQDTDASGDQGPRFAEAARSLLGNIFGYDSGDIVSPNSDPRAAAAMREDGQPTGRAVAVLAAIALAAESLGHEPEAQEALFQQAAEAEARAKHGDEALGALFDSGAELQASAALAAAPLTVQVDTDGIHAEFERASIGMSTRWLEQAQAAVMWHRADGEVGQASEDAMAGLVGPDAVAFSQTVTWTDVDDGPVVSRLSPGAGRSGQPIAHDADGPDAPSHLPTTSPMLIATLVPQQHPGAESSAPLSEHAETHPTAPRAEAPHAPDFLAVLGVTHTEHLQVFDNREILVTLESLMQPLPGQPVASSTLPSGSVAAAPLVVYQPLAPSAEPQGTVTPQPEPTQAGSNGSGTVPDTTGNPSGSTGGGFPTVDNTKPLEIEFDWHDLRPEKLLDLFIDVAKDIGVIESKGEGGHRTYFFFDTALIDQRFENAHHETISLENGDTMHLIGSIAMFQEMALLIG